MQVEGYLSIKDVSQLCGCKPQNISKKLNKYQDYYKPYIIRENRRIFIKKEAVELLKNNNHNNQKRGCKVVNNQKNGCNTSKSAVVNGCNEVVNPEEIQELKDELKQVKTELKKRNERIDELTDELLKINKTVAPLIAYYGKGVPLEDSINTHLIEASNKANTDSQPKPKLKFKDKIKILFS